MRVRRGLVLARAALLIAGYGLTLSMDEPKEVNTPGRVSPQRPPEPTQVPGGCPLPSAGREEGVA